MNPDERNSPTDKKPWWRRIVWDFYYVEKVGSRQYLRVTPFFWVTIILSLLFFFGWLLYQKYQEDIRYNIAPQSTQKPSPVSVYRTQ